MTQYDTPSRPSHVGFFTKRIMSILGFVPLGVYVVLHLWTNLSSLGGPVVYENALRQSRNHPAFFVLEILLGLAIFLHAVIGIKIILKWRSNLSRVRTMGNLKFTLQRLSGIGLALFIVAHVVKARILPSFQPPYIETFLGMRHAFSEPLTIIVYGFGMLGVSFHLANGLWTFCLTWGLLVTQRAQRLVSALSVLFFITLLAMATLSIYGFVQPLSAEWFKPEPS